MVAHSSNRPLFKQRHSGSSVLVSSSKEAEMQQPSWFETNFTVLRSLGNGTFSDACEVFDKQRGGTFAVKRTKQAFGGTKDRLVLISCLSSMFILLTVFFLYK